MVTNSDTEGIKFNETSRAVTIRNASESTVSHSIKPRADTGKINHRWWSRKCSTYLKNKDYFKYSDIWQIIDSLFHYSLTPAKLKPQFHRRYLSGAHSHVIYWWQVDCEDAGVSSASELHGKFKVTIKMSNLVSWNYLPMLTALFYICQLFFLLSCPGTCSGTL